MTTRSFMAEISDIGLTKSTRMSYLTALKHQNSGSTNSRSSIALSAGKSTKQSLHGL